MRNYRNTQAAKALIFYIFTENIDYRYQLEEEAPKEAKDFDSMLNCMEGSIRHARYRLKKIFKKAKKSDWDEDELFDRVSSVQNKFCREIPILSTMHVDYQDNVFDKFVREPVKEKYEKELKAEMKSLLENTLPNA